METMKIKLSEVIDDIAAGPFGSNLKVSCFVDYGFPRVCQEFCVNRFNKQHRIAA